MQRARGEVELVGFEQEARRLSAALEERRSLLILGRPGSGKTRLLGTVLADFGQPVVYLPFPSTLRGILLDLALELHKQGHPVLRSSTKSAADPAAYLSSRTSCHLKGLLWKALETIPCPVILDDIRQAGFQTYRFLQRLYHAPGMCLIAAARDVRSLGELHRLFWDPRRQIEMMPLTKPQALRLFELAAGFFQLSGIDIEHFQAQVLESAKGNPGEILDMCQRATRPEYRVGSYVKFAPLRIDTVMRFHP